MNNKKIKKKFYLTESNHVLIECKVNSINGKFIIDTGASNSCINYLFAKKFNINFKKAKENASSATDKINETFYSKNNILEIGDLKKTDFEIILFDMSFINKSFIEKNISEVDGILGGDILKEFNASINYKKNEIYLEF